MRFYHVQNGEIVTRRRGPVVNESVYTDEDGVLDERAFLAANAERGVYPEHVIEPTLEPWQFKGPRQIAFNRNGGVAGQVEITWPVEDHDLSEFKMGAIRSAISEATRNSQFTDRELIWAIADFALPVDILPNAYRDAILTEERAIINAIKDKVQAIRSATNHADVLAARDL